MRFPYFPDRIRKPDGSYRFIYRPVVPVEIAGSATSRTFDSLLDSGADVTIFPASLAETLGVALDGLPVMRGAGMGGGRLEYQLATVKLRLSDGRDEYIWCTKVGFTESFIKRPVAGRLGFLHFFDLCLFGDRRQIEILPNAAFPGGPEP